MTTHLPPLHAVISFEAVGRHGSFHAAARELNIPLETIVQHIRNLEEQFCARLFKDTSGKIELTDLGKTYLQSISLAVFNLSDASNDMISKRDEGLVISSEPSFAAKWLMPKLDEFSEYYPEFDVNIISTSELADIHNDEVDVAIRFNSATLPADVETDLISSLLLFPYGAPDFSIANSPSDLFRYRLLHEDTGGLWTRWFRKAGNPNFTFPDRTERQQSMIAIEAAIEGQGIVLSSDILIKEDVKKENIKQLSEFGSRLGEYRLIYSKQAKKRQPVKAFREWVLSHTVQYRQKDRV
ncbi:MAG: LysR substrate-binding domain-containing protein [Pseudomonadota bacterium]